MKRFIQLTLLLFTITCLSSVVVAEEATDSWLDAWRDAVGMKVGDPTPVFDDLTDDEVKEPPSEKKIPRKKFVSPAASDAVIPGTAETAGDMTTQAARLNPNTPPLNALIIEWLRIAEPPINATDGARAYYDEYGRMLGKLVGAVAQADRKPDGVGSRSSQEYAWSFRDKLDSVDHCTLEVYVTKKIANQPTNDCRGRYKPIVKDVVGMTKRNARMKLSELGLNSIVLRKRATPTKQSPTSEDDMIVESTSPPAGTTVERNSTVYVELREPPPDDSTKTASKPAADINPFDGDDNSWIDMIRGREAKRSENNAIGSQIATGPPGSAGSTDRTGFTSDGLLDDLDDIEKMTKKRPDVGGRSVAVTQPGANTGTPPPTGGDAGSSSAPPPTETAGDPIADADSSSAAPSTETAGGPVADAGSGSESPPTGTTGEPDASIGSDSTPPPAGTTDSSEASTSESSGVSSGGGGPVTLTAQSILGPWNFAGSRRDGKSRTGSMTFNANRSYSFTIVDADGQSNGSGSGNWGLSGTRLSLDYPAPRSDWSGTASGNSATFTYTNNHGSYRYTRSQGWVAPPQPTPSPASTTPEPQQPPAPKAPEPSDPKWVLVDTQTNPANAETRFSGGPGGNYYQDPRYDGKTTIYSITRNSITLYDHDVDRDFVYHDAWIVSGFSAPPATLNPGEKITLYVEFTKRGTVSSGEGPGIIFDYRIGKRNTAPYTYSPWRKSWSGRSKVTYNLDIPRASRNSELIISAGWWNCASCSVVWKYKAQ